MDSWTKKGFPDSLPSAGARCVILFRLGLTGRSGCQGAEVREGTGHCLLCQVGGWESKPGLRGLAWLLQRGAETEAIDLLLFMATINLAMVFHVTFR